MKLTMDDLLAKCKARLDRGSYYSHVEALRVLLSDVIMPEFDRLYDVYTHARRLLRDEEEVIHRAWLEDEDA